MPGAFEQQFGPPRSSPPILRSPPYTLVAECANACMAESIVKTTVLLPDVNNACHQLDVELFSNTTQLLLLSWVPRREPGRRRVVVRAAA